ncbi:sensor histidine kinase [Paludicola sp. MB14-C6]|uniref:sensor histidine kinase n=1 Tax=Paludihabitans sp. MB14-C6 TaxID=3070656 RepID=UPI0027DCFC5A|nr:sensor histidine kinase [Paludicola sp. MB14-C6]WMJ21841.1 sensor histidine kinase [Paludicola sp. MB14-C6]
MKTRLKKLSQQIARFYKNSSIQMVISVSFTIVAVLGMIFIGLSLLSRFRVANNDLIAQSNTRVLEQVNINLDAYLKNLRRVSDSTYYRIIKNTDLKSESLNEKISLLYDTNRDNIVSIAVFTENGRLVSSVPISNMNNNITPTNEGWFISAINKMENLHFSTPHVQNLFYDPSYLSRWVVSLSRKVELTYGGNTEGGVLLVDMSFSSMEQICKEVSLGKSGYIYLVDRNGEIIYHPRQQLLYAGILNENNHAAVKYEDGNHVETYKNQKRLVTVKTVGYTGWKIVGVTPTEDILADTLQIRIYGIIIILFTIFLLVFANIFLTSRIVDPIKELENCVKEIEKGKLDIDIDVSGSYEIQHLSHSIYSMVNTMRQLMDDIVTQHEMKRKDDLEALQSQINPHFLYNTLDSIVWMIENERYEGAITMVTALARLFRISLSKGDHIIKLSDEIAHAQYYLTIQSIRYKNRFSVEYDISPEINELSIIKLVLQPLIENAIYHAMEFMDGDGMITIRGYCQDNEVILEVEDNGPGMAQEKVESLLLDVMKSNTKGAGIGLCNVYQRIRLTYGAPYGLEIQSEEDKGTVMRIRIPYRKYEDGKS